MDLEKLAEVVEDMIVQHDYPGFEPRALKLGLPEACVNAPSKTFGQALGHPSVYVRLAALRWFQERPGLAKNKVNAVLGLFAHDDPFVRLEALHLVERFTDPSKEMLVKVATMLTDSDPEVQRTAARACGKLSKKLKIKDQSVIDGLQKAASAGDPLLRGKAEKALRVMGAYD